ncbi:uncharacterized protein [Rutidosis leptorrhynchoides]|uniref:uncharacterized protein n=1 Tax=Rutidosis leptorrhynchoides TaxID=125765 RepID=UPI003A992EF7
MNVLRMKVGDGRSIRFWKDNWRGGGVLKDKYGRLFHLEVDKNCSLADRLSSEGRHWSWVHDIGSRNTGILLEMLTELGDVTISSGGDTWYRVVNGETRLATDRLPTRQNLSRRGLEIE